MTRLSADSIHQHKCVPRRRFCKCSLNSEVNIMRTVTFLALAVIAGIGISASTPKAEAQVNIAIGVAPDCPYGYYDTAPYGCAPTGYYGPEWFNGGVFIGAGPWFHGPADFHGHVNNRMHPEHGYNGPRPQ